MTKMIFALAAAASLVSLSACDKNDHTIVAGGPKDTAEVNTVGIVLPPAITASKTYRCKDNSLVFIDWLNDGTARIKKDKNDVGTTVKLGEAGAPLSGSATDANITYNGKACHG
jgi:hypothetical protein